MQARHQAPSRLDQAIAATCTIAIVVELVVRDARLSTAVPAAVVACVPLAWRRVWAVAAFLVTWAGLGALLLVVSDFDAVSVGFIFVFFLSMYSLGAYADGREQPISVVLVIASILYFLFNDGDPFYVGDIPFAIIMVGGPWAAGLAIRLRQDRVRSLNEENIRLQADQEEATRRAVETERATIARELHDVVSHAISVTVLQARGARRQLGADDQAVRRALDAIEQTNTSALSDMRRLLAVLRDTESDEREAEHAPAPSLEHLPSLLDQVRDSGVPVELHVLGTPVTVPPGVDLSAYRIVQEALTNVLKHAGDARATVSLDYSLDSLTVSIADDGTRPPPNGTSTGHGLIGIKERVSVVGGELEAGPRRQGGFEIRARLPYSVELG